MDDRDTLATLISAPLQPLDERWRSADFSKSFG